jgi:predicted regulator of Ras-like GTPase activity (Roadblock/LC7/MglB family)
MTDSKAQRLAAALNDFLRTSPNAEAAAVVSFDGLTMASALPRGMDEERMGAMSAALLGLGEQAAIGLGRGELNQLFVEGESGFVFLMSAQNQAVLAVVTDRAAKIGFVLYEMRTAAAKIGSVLLGELGAPSGSVAREVGSSGSPVAHVARIVDGRSPERLGLVEHEIHWAPSDVDAPPYEPGPLPAELKDHPYYLSQSSAD